GAGAGGGVAISGGGPARTAVEVGGEEVADGASRRGPSLPSERPIVAPPSACRQQNPETSNADQHLHEHHREQTKTDDRVDVKECLIDTREVVRPHESMLVDQQERDG